MASDKDFAIEFGLDPKTGDPIPDKDPRHPRAAISDPSTPRMLADAASEGATRALRLSPLNAFNPSRQNLNLKLADWYKGLPPEKQRAVSFFASTALFPELVAAGLPEGAGFATTALARGSASAAGSAFSDLASGSRVDPRMAAISAGAEVPGMAMEGAGRFLKETPTGQKLVTAAGENFARVSKPIQDMARQYGTKFSEMFPGTAEAIKAASEKASGFYNQVAKRIDMARRGVTEGAQKKVLDTAQAELSGATENLESAGKALKKARLDKGIWVDPEKEIRNAKIGPVERQAGTAGGKHQLQLSLESQMPTDIPSLQLNYRMFLDTAEKLPKEERLKQAVRLKDAFQDAKFVTGKIPRGLEHAVNSHISTLDKMVSDIDPAYKKLETNWSQAKDIHDQATEHVNDALKFKSKNIPESKTEKYGKNLSAGQFEDDMRAAMKSPSGSSREFRQRTLSRVPGARDVAGNVAAQALSQPFTSRALYRGAALAGLPISMAAGQMMGGHPLRGAMMYGPTALGILAATSPEFYRYLLTTEKPFAAAGRAATTGAKALIAAKKSTETDDE